MKNWNTESKPEYGTRVLVQTQGSPDLQIWRLEPDEEFGEVWTDDNNDIHGVSEVVCWQELPELNFDTGSIISLKDYDLSKPIEIYGGEPFDETEPFDEINKEQQ